MQRSFTPSCSAPKAPKQPTEPPIARNITRDATKTLILKQVSTFQFSSTKPREVKIAPLHLTSRINYADKQKNHNPHETGSKEAPNRATQPSTPGQRTKFQTREHKRASFVGEFK